MAKRTSLAALLLALAACAPAPYRFTYQPEGMNPSPTGRSYRECLRDTVTVHHKNP